LIKIHAVSKAFGAQVVLDGVNITIDKGEIFGLVGVSGAGKSTLLRCVNRLVPIDAGKIEVDGVDISELSGGELHSYRRKVGMVFQQFSLMERRTVYENVYLPLHCAGVKRTTASARINELLDLIGLGGKGSSLPRELSGGQKQRVAIARALVSQPRLLLCDEATSALDPNVTEDVLDLLKQINRDLGITIIVVTHEMAVMKNVCTRMGLLHNGRLTATADVQHFFLKTPELLAEFSRDTALKPSVNDDAVRYRVVLRSEGNPQSLARLAIDSGVDYQLLWGGFDRYRAEINGSFVVAIPSTTRERFESTMDSLTIEWEAI